MADERILKIGEMDPDPDLEGNPTPSEVGAEEGEEDEDLVWDEPSDDEEIE